MKEFIRRMEWALATVAEAERLLTREWLVTNGLGGYASGTVAGAVTRRYHGLLVAALPAPVGRIVLLNHLSESFKLPDGKVINIGGEERVGGSLALHTDNLREFELDAGLPVWRYALGDAVLEKRLLLPHRQNTVHVTYRLVSGPGAVTLTLRPSIHFRPHEAPVNRPIEGSYALTAIGDRYELTLRPHSPTLRFYLHGDRPAFTIDGRSIPEVVYRVEQSRGYEASGDLWSPGFFVVELAPGQEVTLVASAEPWEIVNALTPAGALAAERERRRRLLALAPPPAREGAAGELVLAADQFIITPAGRVEDSARARAAGDEVRTVIAGYHWFTDWGRDTMISLDGLTLVTGRHLEAGYILRTFAYYVRDGLIPNLFPEGENRGLYHTADATLWYFHAVDRYLDVTNDRMTLELLLPVLVGIADHHRHGTHFGIGVDPEDGLLREGAPGYQLTWMDAKVDDWVVTPRRGKPVEINALWYNALRLLEGWVRDMRGEAAARPYQEAADRAYASFNHRFWYKDGDYLYDVLDGEHGDDAACRPNQIFAVSLRHPVLDAARWDRVVEVVRERLLTPLGLRSLSADHPDYKAKYYGDLRARDAAYHQGTVWAWLIGAFIDAWLKLHPADRDGARKFLLGFVPHLSEAGIGSISEIFDAETPFTPRGCVAQAWSVAEVLRAWVKTSPDYQ
jgi:predicted glycogen debranching enzyme